MESVTKCVSQLWKSRSYEFEKGKRSMSKGRMESGIDNEIEMKIEELVCKDKVPKRKLPRSYCYQEVTVSERNGAIRKI